MFKGKPEPENQFFLCFVPISHGNYGSSCRFSLFPQPKNHEDFFMDMIFNDEMYVINLHNFIVPGFSLSWIFLVLKNQRYGSSFAHGFRLRSLTVGPSIRPPCGLPASLSLPPKAAVISLDGCVWEIAYYGI